MSKSNTEENKDKEQNKEGYSSIGEDGFKLWLFIVISIFAVSFAFALVDYYTP